MLTLSMLAAVTIVGVILLEKRKRENPKRKSTRIYLGILAAVLFTLLIIHTGQGGLTRSNIVITTSAILIAAVLYFRAKREQSNGRSQNKLKASLIFLGVSILITLSLILITL